MGQISLFLSPSSQLVKLAKRLKKEKVNVDIINFGEEVSTDPLRGIGLDSRFGEDSLPPGERPHCRTEVAATGPWGREKASRTLPSCRR